MKGKWLIALTKRVLDRSIQPFDALNFILWRIHHTDEIRVNGLIFQQADHLSWALITETFFHQEYTPVGDEIRPDSFVVDIGAHRGTFVGFSAQKTRGKIIAIEPDAENFKALQEFIKKNQIKNVDLLNCAIGPSDGKIMVYRSVSSRHTTTGFDQVTGEKLSDVMEVPSMKLSTLLAPYSQVDFLKMDCEGAEYEIIENADIDTLKKIKALSMEAHNIESQAADFYSLCSKLETVFPTVSIQTKSNALSIITAKSHSPSLHQEDERATGNKHDN
jgi:FkbM family methyltransferase